MKFTRLTIPDIFLIEPTVFGDSRGFFMETYRQDFFHQNGIQVNFVQDNHSRSKKGVLRGLHYQVAPFEQAKLVRVVRGSALDVAVDIRPKSKTFGQHVAVILDDEKKQLLYIPPGFAHGFCALTDDTEFFYKVSSLYSPDHERGILWSDADLGIQWPKMDIDYVLSEKDQKYPCLRDAFQGEVSS